MRSYEFESGRPVIRMAHMDFMCPASDDACESIADDAEEVADGIVLCGKPADVVRVHHTMPNHYLPQCRYCYYASRRRNDPSVTQLQKQWGKVKVEV